VIDRFNDKFTVQQFYDYSLAWLEVSDAVYVLSNNENSKGTQIEIQKAKELNIPIFTNIEDLQDIKEQTNEQKRII